MHKALTNTAWTFYTLFIVRKIFCIKKEKIGNICKYAIAILKLQLDEQVCWNNFNVLSHFHQRIMLYEQLLIFRKDRREIVFRHRCRSSKILLQRYTVGVHTTHARDFPSTMANLFQNFFLNFFFFGKRIFSNVEKRKKRKKDRVGVGTNIDSLLI